MQTFLPTSNFAECARLLDNKRVWKQTVEGMQILNSLTGISKGWQNHPAVKMWRGHEGCLLRYTLSMLDESITRGIKVSRQTQDKLYNFMNLVSNDSYSSPVWLGNAELHRSHQSNLVRKNPTYYKFDVPNDLEYVWPVITISSVVI